MKKRGMGVRIVAIILCALMVLSVFAIALTRAFAYDVEAEMIATTGSSLTWIIFAVAGGVAVIAAVVAVISKKKE